MTTEAILVEYLRVKEKGCIRHMLPVHTITLGMRLALDLHQSLRGILLQDLLCHIADQLFPKILKFNCEAFLDVTVLHVNTHFAKFEVSSARD